MWLLFITVSANIIINITITIRVTLAIVLRNHSHELRSLFVGVSRTAWSQHGQSNILFFQRQLSNTLYCQCKTSVKTWWKARNEWALPLVLMLSQHTPASTVFACFRCQKLFTWTWDLYRYFMGEMSFFYPLKCFSRCFACLVLVYDNINLMWKIQNSEA